jgi:hypothetical protein
MENAGIFYGHWEYFTVIWYILWPFCNVCSGNLVYFPHFGIMCQEKSGNPAFMDYEAKAHLCKNSTSKRTFANPSSK